MTSIQRRVVLRYQMLVPQQAKRAHPPTPREPRRARAPRRTRALRGGPLADVTLARLVTRAMRWRDCGKSVSTYAYSRVLSGVLRAWR